MECAAGTSLSENITHEDVVKMQHAVPWITVIWDVGLLVFYFPVFIFFHYYSPPHLHLLLWCVSAQHLPATKDKNLCLPVSSDAAPAVGFPWGNYHFVLLPVTPTVYDKAVRSRI